MSDQRFLKSGYKMRSIRSTCGRFVYHMAIVDYLHEYNKVFSNLERVCEIMENYNMTKCSKSPNSPQTMSDYASIDSPPVYAKKFTKFLKSHVFSYP